MRTTAPVTALARIFAALLVTAGLAGEARAIETGRITGRVTDEAGGAPVAGVTVTATGPALQGEVTEFTDENGRYLLGALPPGEYLVRFYYSDLVIERPGVKVNADLTLAVNVVLPAEKAKAQVIRITERAPTVDVSHTQLQTVISRELVRTTPVRGRTYEGVLSLTPGSATDDVGSSFNGATGPENVFLIDGMNSTNVSYGLIGTRLTLEFVEETQVITGGYNAEYGRATGGVVNLVTRSGSNEVKGELFMGLTPLQLDPVRVGRLGEAISSDRFGRYKELDVGFTVGGPIVKDRLWFFAGYHPQYSVQRYDRILRRRLARDIAGFDGAVYPGDVAGGLATDPEAQRQQRLAACPETVKARGEALCVGGGFLTEDIPGADRTLYSGSWLHNYVAKLDGRIDDDNRVSLEYIGSPSTFDGIFGNPNDPVGHHGVGLNNDPAIMPFKEVIQVHDVLGRYTSKLLDRRLRLDVMVGYHMSANDVDPRARGARVTDTNERSLAQFEAVGACQPQVIDGVVFNPCPVTSYGYGGFGFFSKIFESRLSGSVAATYVAQALGSHELKLGGDVESQTYESTRGYTTGSFYLVRSRDRVRQQSFGTEDADTGDIRLFGDEGFTAKSASLREMLYLRDSYSPSFLPGLTLNAGVRWELEQVKGVDGTTAFSLNDNIAPRLGAVYDFTRKGLSKLYAFYGRFYEAVPLDIADRAFSREAIVLAGGTGCGRDARGLVDPASCTFPEISRDSAIVLGGTTTPVSPQLKGQYSNQLTAGVEYDVGWETVLGAAYVHQDLGRVIEDISVDGGNHYFIANPGEPADPGVVQDLEARIRSVGSELATASGDAAEALAAEKDELASQLTLLKGAANFPKPKRVYNALQLTARKRFTRSLTLLASYTYSRTIGNYPGLYSASNSQLDPNISSQFDLAGLLLNRDGPLPNDRPHNVRVAASYFIPTGSNDSDGVYLGATFSAVSGVPIDVLGSHPAYGAVESFILPRGSAGRTPMLTSLDLRLSYVFDVVEASWEVYNALNQRAVVGVDEEYTFDDVVPIVNGTVKDLESLRTTSGGKPRLNPNYGQPTGYQAPLAMRFALRARF